MTKNVKKTKVLDEDHHLKNIEEIIERDFFTDLKDLKAKKELFEAQDKQDFAKTQSIMAKYSINEFGEKCADALGLANIPSETKNCSLNQYLSKYTSEDNASFASILQDLENERMQKMSWCYETEKKFALDAASQKQQSDCYRLPLKSHNEHPKDENLALVPFEEINKNGQLPLVEVLLETKDNGSVESWAAYKVHNSLMFPAEGTAMTDEEVEFHGSNYHSVVYENTRFKKPTLTVRESLKLNQSNQIIPGKIGVDGKEVQAFGDTPKRDGFTYIPQTPNVTPGNITAGDDSPLMTWGAVENTPAKLEGLDLTPFHFSIQKPCEREEIHLALTEENNRNRRAKRKLAVSTFKSYLSSRPGTGNSSSSFSTPLSVKRSRCASSTRSTNFLEADLDLRASYSPALSGRASKKRQSTASSSRRSTPFLISPSHSTKDQVSLTLTVGPKSHLHSVSVTDNLLDLTKK